MIDNTFDKVKKSYNELKSLRQEAIKELKNKETRKKQIPNMLTASRLFSPLFIIPSALCGNLLLTAIFTGLFSITDALDGFLARKLNCSSEFGRKLDPITDKVFASSLLIPIAILSPVLTINLALEGIIALINVKSQIENKSPKTNYIGKVKTWFLYSSILLGYLGTVVDISNLLFTSFISITTLLQVSAGAKYYLDYKKKDDNYIKEEKKESIPEKKEENEEIKKLKEYKNYVLNKKNENTSPLEKEKVFTKIKTP